ncbi:MAG: asparagine synthase (glutamine-hydrolyzing) [Bacteroidota bacterium]
MCGIFGIIALEDHKLELDLTKVENAISTMSYRGPDAKGIQLFENKAVFAHLRLSIIDLKAESNQPFSIDNDRFWITYNGEIYNYLELKSELLLKGAIFKTESDTEVLLNAYKYWGEDCVNHFNGMWAFVIYDKVEQTFFCSRDRFGVKPFNYALIDNQLVFSSEIKAILSYFPSLKVPNYNAISNYCRSSVGAQHENTWFKDVLRLQPGHNLVIQKGSIRNYRYWHYPTKVNEKISFEEAKNQYLYLFNDSVRLRMRSDVPVGTTLSSGIDSTSIVGSLRTFNNQKHNTYTAAFNSNEYDILEKKTYSEGTEINEAAIVAKCTQELKLNPHFVDIQYDDALNELKKIVFHLESGNSSPAIFPLMKVMEKAKKDVTVILEGQGADELLGGYITSLFGMVVIEYLKEFKFKELFYFVKNFSKSYTIKDSLVLFFRILSNEMGFISKLNSKMNGFEKIYGKKLENCEKLKDYPPYEGQKCKNSINEFLRKQHMGGLVNLLHYGDAISMANSLESRLPFMDYRLVEFAFELPWQYKIHHGLGKYIHRKAMKGLVPDFILNNPVKFGFNTPISQFFKNEYGGIIKPIEILRSEKFMDRGLFNREGIEKLINEHNNKTKNHSNLLFRILCVELWFNQFIDS